MQYRPGGVSGQPLAASRAAEPMVNARGTGGVDAVSTQAGGPRGCSASARLPAELSDSELTGSPACVVVEGFINILRAILLDSDSLLLFMLYIL